MPAINLKDFSAGTLRTSSLMFRKKVLKSFGRIGSVNIFSQFGLQTLS